MTLLDIRLYDAAEERKRQSKSSPLKIELMVVQAWHWERHQSLERIIATLNDEIGSLDLVPAAASLNDHDLRSSKSRREVSPRKQTPWLP